MSVTLTAAQLDYLLDLVTSELNDAEDEDEKERQTFLEELLSSLDPPVAP